MSLLVCVCVCVFHRSGARVREQGTDEEPHAFKERDAEWLRQLQLLPAQLKKEASALVDGPSVMNRIREALKTPKGALALEEAFQATRRLALKVRDDYRAAYHDNKLDIARARAEDIKAVLASRGREMVYPLQEIISRLYAWADEALKKKKKAAESEAQ